MMNALQRQHQLINNIECLIADEILMLMNINLEDDAMTQISKDYKIDMDGVNKEEVKTEVLKYFLSIINQCKTKLDIE